MSKKRKKSKKRKAVRAISKSQKVLYIAVFCGSVAILTVFALWMSDIYRLLHKSMRYLYIEPTPAAYIMFYVLIGMGLIFTVYFYSSLMDGKKTLKQIRQKAKIILPIYLVSAIAISVFCYSSFYYIDDSIYSEKTLFTTREIFSTEDIDKINIYVSGVPLPTNGRVAIEYSISCALITKSGEYTIHSDYFYSYRDIYNYLSGLNATVEADRYKLENLIEYQRRPANFSAEKVCENIEYINKIFDLENILCR